jgi:23S rRNA (adenine-N6)-dimethyltransferase
LSRTLPGRHELGQNFLVDPAVVDTFVGCVAAWPDDRPLLELGPGNGALTAALAVLRRPLAAVELDPRRVAHLRGRFGTRVEVVHGDLLDADLSTGADIVSNVPFGLTTPLLRRLLRAEAWRHALLLVQWEVARKRAGVGGTTMLTAQWWPWYELELRGRVPARSFRPVPAVDGGLLELRRRPVPLLADRDRTTYQRMVKEVFAGAGRGAVDVVGRRFGRAVAASWASAHGVGPTALPRDLGPSQWVGLAGLRPSSRGPRRARR